MPANPDIKVHTSIIRASAFRPMLFELSILRKRGGTGRIWKGLDATELTFVLDGVRIGAGQTMAVFDPWFLHQHAIGSGVELPEDFHEDYTITIKRTE